MVDSSPSAPSSPPFTNLSHKRYRSSCTAASTKDSSTPLLLTSSKHHHADTASRTITAWRKVHEITVLKGILEYYRVIGKYPFYNESHVQKFYEEWIEWRGIYVDQDVFTNKLVELLQRFFQNKQLIAFGENVLMDNYDAEIYHLSHLIWGQEDDSDQTQMNVNLQLYRITMLQLFGGREYSGFWVQNGSIRLLM